MRRILSVAAAAFAFAAAPVSAELVDFETLPGGATFNPLTISGATFFTNNGFNVIADLGNKSLCASPTSANAADCSMTLEILFGQKASNISFDFIGNNELTVGADIGEVTLFGGGLGDVLLGSVNIVVQDDQSFSLDTVQAAGFSNVTRMFITSTDFGGIIYDNFGFQLAVPEPASWAMMIAGFGLAGSALRRRGRAAAAA